MLTPIILTIMGIGLISCAGPSKTATSMPDCPLIEDFNIDVAEGDGHATPQQALEAFVQDEHLPGTPTIETEEESRVVWALLDSGEKIGSIEAALTDWELWVISRGEWCIAE